MKGCFEVNNVKGVAEYDVIAHMRDHIPLDWRHEEICGCADGCGDKLRSHPMRDCNLWDAACYHLLKALARDVGVL